GAMARSSRPSPFRSPSAIELGLLRLERARGGSVREPPPAWPRKTEVLGAPWATARASRPSPFGAPMGRERAPDCPVPVGEWVAAGKVPLPVPRKTEIVPAGTKEIGLP